MIRPPKSYITLIASSLFLAFCGYLFHFIVGKELGPEAYGLVCSLLAIVYIINIFLHSIQATVTTKISEVKSKFPQQLPATLNFFFRKNIKLSLIAYILFIISIPFISKFLHSGDYFPVFLLSILVFSSFLLPVTRGFFQGMQQFQKLSITYFFEGLIKIGSLIFLLGLWKNLSSAIISLSASYLLPFLIALPLLPRFSGIKIKEPKYKLINHLTLLLGFMALFYSADILLVKHFFSAYESGLYSAASLYGKVIILSSIPLAMILLPKSVEAHIKDKNTLTILKKMLYTVLLIGLPLVIIYFIIPKALISLTLGASFLPATKMIGLYSINALLISLSYIMVYHLIGIKKEKELWVPIMLIWSIELILIASYHGSIFQVLITLIISSLALTTYLLSYIIYLSRTTKYI